MFGGLLRRFWPEADAGHIVPLGLGADEVLYAVGDVHGLHAAAMALEAAILADAALLGALPVIVYLGDVVDRGPESARMLDLVLSRPDGWRRLALRGNHEDLMLDFLLRPAPGHEWLALGGRETLLSYGVPEGDLSRTPARRLESLVRAHVPDEHVALLGSLPLGLDAGAALLVHAGLRPGVPPARQAARDLMWFRDGYAADYAESPALVVHGHSPLERATLFGQRLGLDTGAYDGGPLSAARLVPGVRPVILSVVQTAEGAWLPLPAAAPFDKNRSSHGRHD